MKYYIPVFFCLILCSFWTRKFDIPEPIKHVDQVLWVVDDLTNTMKQWANLGFNQIVDLDTVAAELKIAGKVVKLRVAKANLGGANITWIQPLEEASVFSEFHNSYGDGALSLVHRVENNSALQAELNRLSAIGLNIKEEISIKTNKGNLYYVLMDTRHEGKYYLGYTQGDQDIKMMKELSSENLHNMKINQYAFAIRNEKPVSAYWQKVGFPEFQMNHPELGNKHYYSKPVDHDLIQGWQRHGDVAYEWCIPVSNPIVYDDHIKKHGEGIHHLAFTVQDMDKVLDDYKSKGYVISMGGTWGETGKPGSGRYEYIDPENSGGLTLELLWSHP
ncbi:MAG TPA: VOC family protein [Bacteroidales bacterium]|nr:VOC family protein [Bacteroidales bacterium]